MNNILSKKVRLDTFLGGVWLTVVEKLLKTSNETIN
jgi:hypothetical protein